MVSSQIWCLPCDKLCSLDLFSACLVVVRQIVRHVTVVHCSWDRLSPNARQRHETKTNFKSLPQMMWRSKLLPFSKLQPQSSSILRQSHQNFSAPCSPSSSKPQNTDHGRATPQDHFRDQLPLFMTRKTTNSDA